MHKPKCDEKLTNFFCYVKNLLTYVFDLKRDTLAIDATSRFWIVWTYESGNVTCGKPGEKG